jgi:ABC-type Na+ transport system ATPase subunit NatA
MSSDAAGAALTMLDMVYTNSEPAAEMVADGALNIDHGKLFGLLRPDGSEKAARPEELNILPLAAGTTRVSGVDDTNAHREVRRRISYVRAGDCRLHDQLSARDDLRDSAELYDVSRWEEDDRINECHAPVIVRLRISDTFKTQRAADLAEASR